ncbi:MAG TPA: sigma-70 family RNA polymerase sigma factor [Terracidiphilus sp.]|jgi:RNA polymerase sigma-70 factor (ECF subfamily)|nr:sigma-70 family RNA polymerase sigma factor [Terracidiphilus sp.]
MRPELIQASKLLRRNTPDTVAEAIGLLQSTVYSFSMKVCGHREDAEDTMQDVLFRSLHHLAKLRDAPALAAWLYTVTRNRCRRIRRSPFESPAARISLDEYMPGEAELAQLLLDGEKTPEARLLHGEEHHLLHQAVLRVPSTLRMVLVLHDMEELDTAQVAQILGLRQGTVRARLHRARLAVRREVSEPLIKSAGAGGDLRKAARRKPSPASQRRQRPKECRELFANLSEYLDGRLASPTCEQMRSHIEACPTCVAFLRDLRAAIDRCRSLEIPCDATIPTRMRELLTREYLRLLGTSNPTLTR